ncbi:AIPR family protein [Pseudoduganella sp. S-14]|uniref:AIPR family protein n=1 Tax=Pseudoduganella sp. S-14 TaxID=3404065 RepID=UPI003CEE5DEF
MSKLHVKQIQGYINSHLAGAIDMSDYESHSDQAVIDKAFLTRGLGILAVSSLTDAPLKGLTQFITDGSKDGGVDLIYFDTNERTLYLVQTKWHDDGHGSIELGDALKFIEGVRKILDNDLSGFNQRVLARQADIELALYDANARFMLVLAHTGQEALNREVAGPLEEYVTSQNDTSELMSLCVLNQQMLHKAVAAGVAGVPIRVEVQLSSWGQIREPHHAIYGQVCAADVAAWYAANGNRLFEKNLRQVLVGTNVNQDLVTTLTARPESFWYFNNGITAIASEVKKKPIGGNSTDSGIFECAGFSVVNGAQTVGSIHSAYLKDEEKVSSAMVPLRIITSLESQSDFAAEVTRYTNTQNAIEKRDFVALDPQQERIRQELHIEGVEYFYKAGSGTGTLGQRFDLTEATVALACAQADVSLSVQAKREISKLWDDIAKPPYKILFNSGINGPSIWEVVKILRAVDDALQNSTKQKSGRDRLICVHGNRFIQWAAIRALNMSMSTPFAEVEQKIKDTTTSTVDKVIAGVKTHFADSYPSSLFKNLSKCRDLAKKI